MVNKNKVPKSDDIFFYLITFRNQSLLIKSPFKFVFLNFTHEFATNLTIEFPFVSTKKRCRVKFKKKLN